MNLRLKIKDLDCIDCARALEHLAKTIDGVEDASVSFTLSILDLKLSSETQSKTVIRSLKRKGYDAVPVDSAPSAGIGGLRGAVSSRRMLLTGLSGGFLVAALIAHLLSAPASIITAILIAATATALPLTLMRGIYAIRSFQIDMNVLMSVAIIAAALIGEWEEAGVVAFLFSVAIILEALAMARTRKVIESLMELSPDKATVRRDGSQAEVAASDVSPGEVIVVKPGERIPLEGSVVTGTTSVDESPITGEAMPVLKQPGSQVFAGTLNEEGLIEVEVAKPKGESTLARIIHLVEHVEESKAPLERFIDRFARVYTPVVVSGAILMGVVPSLLHLEGDWVYRSLVVLIIACPCALVIATPVAIVSGLTSAARKGILIKGGVHLEQAATVRAIALDKTGTLTEGTPSVYAVRPLKDIDEKTLLRIAASVESASAHPLAGAVMSETRRRGIHWPEPQEAVSITGTGMSATVEGTRYHVVKPEFFIERPGGGQLPLDELGSSTTIAVGTENSVLGTIEFTDRVRGGAHETLSELKDLGMKKAIMITGDRDEVAKDVAHSTGVDEYHADLLPEGKVRVVKELGSQFDVVAMVGDGVNDAPALAAADVGVAMGAAGSDTAIDTADIALMSDDITKLVPLFRISKAVRRITYENISLAVGIKAVFLILAYLGVATMWMAVFADMGASLIVIVNALRLLSDRMAGLDRV
jgi:Cd2+/Zn2+-exporting ATPase